MPSFWVRSHTFFVSTTSLSAPDFIFTVPPNFFICDGPNVSFIETCGILRLDPNLFQRLSEVFQSRKAQIS